MSIFYPSNMRRRSESQCLNSHDETRMRDRNEAKERRRGRQVYFLRNEQPSVRRALPPVGWQSTVEQPAQMTTVCACEKTVVMVKQPGHLTSMKKDRGAGTRFFNLCLRASAAGVGLRRSTARTILTVYDRIFD